MRTMVRGTHPTQQRNYRDRGRPRPQADETSAHQELTV